jgi:hypothetical protein
MVYPREFSPQARARVEAERLKARQQFAQAQGEGPPADWTRYRWEVTGFCVYVLRVFAAFAHEACDLGTQRTWTVDRVRSVAEEFLRRFTVEAYYEEFREVTSHSNRSLLPKMERSFRNSPQWHQFEAELLAVAERQAGLEAGTPVNDAGSRRAEVDAFILKCKQETSLNVTRGHIWRLAGHQAPRQFQFWQASDPKATAQDDHNFRRILAMTPQAFVDLLKKKGLI